MAIKKQNILLFTAVLGTAVFISCGGEKKSENSDEISVVDTTSVATSTLTETFSQVPSPGEMFNFIKLVGGKNNKNISFLNSVDNQKKYVDIKSQALNFGIYSCDLSYCSVFEIGAEALKYFKTVKQLGDQIGVSSVIKPEVLNRLQSNVGNKDSLAKITDDIYYSSFETLEQSKQGPTLALVVAGGWIESLYIASNLSKYDEKSPMTQRLADQKYTLDHLIEFLKKHDVDTNSSSVVAQFIELQNEFNKLTEIEAPETAPATTSNESKTILTGGKILVMTKEQNQAIVDKIKSIRNSFTLSK